MSALAVVIVASCAVGLMIAGGLVTILACAGAAKARRDREGDGSEP